MKINILFFLPNLHGGGAERVAVNFIRALDQKKYNILLVLVNKEGNYLELIPEHVKIFDLQLSKTIFSIFKLHFLIKKTKPEIVFSTLFHTHIAMNFALIGLKKRPFIILRSPNSPRLLLKHGELNIIRKYFLERAYRKADIILAQTPEMKTEIVKYHQIEVKKIQVFLNPLDTDYINSKIHNVKNPFDEKFINVVAVGRLTRQKGFDILLESFRKVIEENNNFFLHIIGKDGGEKEELIKLVNNLNIRENVKFWDFQQNPYKFYFFSDLFVLSSRWEGLPNTILENLYLGKPIVATKCIPFMSELIHNKKNGFLVDTGDSNQMANAILNFRNLKLSDSLIVNTKNDINELLEKYNILNKWEC